MQIELRKQRTGNICTMCGKVETGRYMRNMLLTVWYRAAGDKRGNNMPVCSDECADRCIKYLKGLAIK